MIPRIALLLAAMAALLAAAPGAQAGSSPVPNGSYVYAASSYAEGGPLIIFQATVKGNRITAGTLFSQQWWSQEGTVFADTGPPVITRYKAVTISRRGTFRLGSKSTDACYSGIASKRRLSLVNCGPQFDEGGPELTAYKKTLKIEPGIYNGTSTASQASDPDGPEGQPTGAVGSFELTFSSTAITSGNGTFAPVSSSTGLPTGGAQVSVTYGRASVNRTTGIFALPSTPAGYDLCGAILPSGKVLGLVTCQQKNYQQAVFTATQGG